MNIFLTLRSCSQRKADLFKMNGARVLRKPAPNGIHNGARLFVDLLEHEVAVTALLGHDRVPHHAGDLPADLRAFEIGDLHSLIGQDRHLIVVQEQHIPGSVQDRGDIGGEKEFALAEPDHEGAAFARAHHDIGIALIDHRDRVGAFQMPGRLAHRLFQGQALLGDAVDQMGDHFRVRLGLKDAPLRRKILLSAR